MTMITLEALGVRERIATFPSDLVLNPDAMAEIEQELTLTLWEDVLDVVREARRSDLEGPVAAAVAAGRRARGLAPSHRSRRTPGPPPTAAPPGRPPPAAAW